MNEATSAGAGFIGVAGVAGVPGVVVALIMAAGCGAPSPRASADSVPRVGGAATPRGASPAATPSLAPAPGSASAPITSREPSRNPPQTTSDKHSTPSRNVTLDTARGVVQRIGAEPLTSLVLLAPGSREQMVLQGPALALLAAVEGLEIVVRGNASSAPAGGATAARVFDVESFLVRAAEGTTAFDGIVVRDAGGFALRLHDGALRQVPHMPAALQSSIGRRVFLAGPLDRPPVAYGVIAPRP